MSLHRRKFVKNALALSAVGFAPSSLFAFSENLFRAPKPFQRVRPGDPLWPSEAAWQRLKGEVNGNLAKLQSPLNACKISPASAGCEEVFQHLKNPYYIGDTPAFTQTSGWLDAWQSEPSVYAVAAQSTADIAAAVNFARTHNLRLVIKGGGHSYQGTSNAADSLLVWTRGMNNITMHDAFLPKGCEGKTAAQPAVTIEAGARWLEAYNAVTTKGGRYVQGGGCTTVGVAGFIQGGGFGSFSKHYGLGAAALLEAELVTADGKIKTVNACNYPDLFWALKGGGGGTFALVSKLTLRTRELPQNFGAVFGSIKASSDEAFQTLIAQFIRHYAAKLFHHQWGEQVVFRRNNTMNVSMLFHGLSQDEAKGCWQDFETWVKQHSGYSFETPLTVMVLPAQRLWDTAFLKQYAAGLIAKDDRAAAPDDNIFWAANREEAGQFLYAYRSAWLPQNLLNENNQQDLVAALYGASRQWTTSLHFNKGLAGAPPDEIEAAKDTAANPAVLDAFALAIIAGEGEPSFKGIRGHEPDYTEARQSAERINRAMAELLKLVPKAGSYVSESDYFEKDWKTSFWGDNYQRLLTIKNKYDPEGLFFVHHGVGSEAWSADGFKRLT